MMKQPTDHHQIPTPTVTTHSNPERPDHDPFTSGRGQASFESSPFQLTVGNRRLLMMVILIVVVMVIKWSQGRSAHEQENSTATTDYAAAVGRTIPEHPALSTTTDNETAPRTYSPQTILDESILARQLASELTDPTSQTHASSLPSTTLATELSGSTGSTENSLQPKLKPLQLSPSVATVLPNRDAWLTQGALIDCQLETRLVSTQPGMTVCYTTRDVYSASGRVVLLDRGSKVVGYYHSDLKQGQARLFIVWSRIETPQGVIVQLDSPGTGSLGESGVAGDIDHHVWQRFGGTALISLLGDLSHYASNPPRDQTATTIQLNSTAQGTSSLASDVLKESIAIAPTLSKDQGERVVILVARDLDFGKVYQLKLKGVT